MRLIVALVALVAAGVVAGVVLATRQDPPQPKALCTQAPKPLVVPGIGKPTAVAGVRAAFVNWPHGSLAKLQDLVRRYPGDPVVQFNYGSALFCRGYVNDAEAAYRAAKRTGRDTQYEINADNILHPQYFTAGYPIFQPTRADPLLVRGVVLQKEGHQHSAERVYARAARLHPSDDDAQVAAAVGRFDEDNLSASFSRLGPLTKRFPRSQSVRFHLGLLLAWTGQRDEAIRQFRLARGLGPKTVLGGEASAFLEKLVASGTNNAQK